MKVRQDAWTEENDLLLAETVLRHVRDGSTQLNAFEEVGDALERTSAACGFRWNSVVRQQYEQSLSLARKQRKQRQRILGIEQTGKKKILYKPLTLENFESITSTLENQVLNSGVDTEFAAEPLTENAQFESVKHENVKFENLIPQPTFAENSVCIDDVIAFLHKQKKSESYSTALKAENERLKLEILELERKNNELSKQLGSVKKSSDTIQEDYEALINIMNRARKLAVTEADDRQSTKFKMDRNGNLEKLAE